MSTSLGLSATIFDIPPELLYIIFEQLESKELWEFALFISKALRQVIFPHLCRCLARRKNDRQFDRISRLYLELSNGGKPTDSLHLQLQLAVRQDDNHILLSLLHILSPTLSPAITSLSLTFTFAYSTRYAKRDIRRLRYIALRYRLTFLCIDARPIFSDTESIYNWKSSSMSYLQPLVADLMQRATEGGCQEMIVRGPMAWNPCQRRLKGGSYGLTVSLLPKPAKRSIARTVYFTLRKWASHTFQYSRSKSPGAVSPCTPNAVPEPPRYGVHSLSIPWSFPINRHFSAVTLSIIRQSAITKLTLHFREIYTVDDLVHFHRPALTNLHLPFLTHLSLEVESAGARKRSEAGVDTIGLNRFLIRHHEQLSTLRMGGNIRSVSFVYHKNAEEIQRRQTIYTSTSPIANIKTPPVWSNFPQLSDPSFASTALAVSLFPNLKEFTLLVDWSVIHICAIWMESSDTLQSWLRGMPVFGMAAAFWDPSLAAALGNEKPDVYGDTLDDTVAQLVTKLELHSVHWKGKEEAEEAEVTTQDSDRRTGDLRQRAGEQQDPIPMLRKWLTSFKNLKVVTLIEGKAESESGDPEVGSNFRARIDDYIKVYHPTLRVVWQRTTNR